MRGVASAASVVFLAAVASKLASFLRDPILASRFGANELTDGFFVLVTCVFLGTNLVAMPVFLSLQVQISEWTAAGTPWPTQVGWSSRTALRASGLAAIVSLVAAVLLALAQHGVLTSDSVALLLAATFGAFLASMGNAAALLLAMRHRFGMPAVASIVGNLTVVGGVFVGPSPLVHQSWFLPALFTSAIGIQALPAVLFLEGASGQATRRPNDLTNRARLIGAFASALYFQVSGLLLTTGSLLLGPGILTSLTYAAKINTVVYETIATSTVTIAAPLILRSIAADPDSRLASKRSLAVAIGLLSPAVISLMICAGFIVRGLYVRQAFSPEAAALTVLALPIHAAVLIPMVVIEVLARSAIARGNGTRLLQPFVLGFGLNATIVAVGLPVVGPVAFVLGMTAGTSLAAVGIWIQEFRGQVLSLTGKIAVPVAAAIAASFPAILVARSLRPSGTLASFSATAAVASTEFAVMALLLLLAWRRTPRGILASVTTLFEQHS